MGVSAPSSSTAAYNSWRALVSADIGLTDNLALLLTAGGKQSDGWQERPGADGGEEDRAGARAALRWTPSDSFESTLALDYVKQDQINYPNVMVEFDGTRPSAVRWRSSTPSSRRPNPVLHGRTPTSTRAACPRACCRMTTSKTWGATWFNTWQFGGGLQLKSITAYRDMEALFGRDGDNSALDYSGDVHDEDQDQFSQELQLASQGNDTFNWIVGALLSPREDARPDAPRRDRRRPVRLAARRSRRSSTSTI